MEGLMIKILTEKSEGYVEMAFFFFLLKNLPVLQSSVIMQTKLHTKAFVSCSGKAEHPQVTDSAVAVFPR